MLTLDYAQIAGLLGVGFAFLAMFTLVGFALGCVFGNGSAEDEAHDGDLKDEAEVHDYTKMFPAATDESEAHA